MGYHILIVDDNRIIRTMAMRAVTMSSLPISSMVEAENGRIALERMRAAPVDLVLLDINMPVMNGEEFLTAMRQDAALRATPVIVVSTESNIQRIARLRAMGAGFVHKPFKPEELVAAVDRLRVFMQPDAGAAHV